MLIALIITITRPGHPRGPAGTPATAQPAVDETSAETLTAGNRPGRAPRLMT